MDIEKLRSRLQQYNQDHVLRFWDELNEVERRSLYEELQDLDLPRLNEAFKQTLKELNESGEPGGIDDRLEPPPESVLGSVVQTDSDTLAEYETEGLKQISEGRVGVLLLAGGQGTRLGATYPKGMYDVGLPSHKSLYHLQAQRIIRLQQIIHQRLGKRPQIPWYIMTSEQTKEPTEKYFEKHSHFGLNKDDVIMFEQSTIPCMDLEGKILLESKSHIARSPDGNGGLYSALHRSGALDDMIRRGLQYLHVYCVDNILVKMADPVFIGFCIAKRACCGAKVVEKTLPTEPVGVICRLDGKYHVVEYSEISLQTAERRNDKGKLVFNAGGIANHFFSIDFMKTLVHERERALKYHVAKKKIPYCDENGENIKPAQINGIKLEKFVFDVFEFANSFAIWEVLREDEFAPLKNGDGAARDTPTTCRESLMNLHHRWALKAGAKFVNADGSIISHIPSSNGNGVINANNSHREDSEDHQIICEISPLVSYGGEGLSELIKGKELTPPVLLWGEGEKPHIIPS